MELASALTTRDIASHAAGRVCQSTAQMEGPYQSGVARLFDQTPINDTL